MDGAFVEKKMRKSYPASFKKQVILYSDEHGNRKAGIQFGVNESVVRKWKNQRVQLFKCERNRRAFRWCKNKFPNVEVRVAEFVRERRKNGLVVSYDIIIHKAREIAKEEKIPRKEFHASRKWVRLFMKREGFSLRRRTSVCQKLPGDFEHKLTAFQQYIIRLRTREDFLPGQIGNADETPIFFDMPHNYTIDEKGAKEVVLKTTGNEKLRVTVMLAITADGRKLPPFLTFKRKTIPKETKTERFPPGVHIRAQAQGWMTEELMIDWIKTVWARRPGALLNLPAMLALDAFRGHLTPAVKTELQKQRTELVVIPAGMTSVLQPLDVSVNKPMKEKVRQQYQQWLSNDNLPTTSTGKTKRASPIVMAGWIKAAWNGIPEKIVVKSFKKCSISNAIDGTEDDLLWEDSDGDENWEDKARDSESSSDSEGDSSSANEGCDDDGEEVAEEEEEDDE